MRSYTRDELLHALDILKKLLTAFPAGEYVIDAGEMSAAPQIQDGAVITSASQMPVDGSPIAYGYGKGQPQPARKQFTLAAKVKPEKIDWDGMPRASRRIAELLAQSTPLTSHTIMQQLQMARPTFSNAMTKLRKKKLIVSVGLHQGGER